MPEYVSTSQRSWIDLVRQADPDWDKDKNQTKKVYEFSNGRTFDDKPNPYA